MSIKNISTVELVKELLSRAEHVDAVMELIESRVAVRTIKPEPILNRVAKRPERRRVSREEFWNEAKKSSIPRTAYQLAKPLGVTYATAYAHTRRLISEGKMRAIEGSYPVLYEVAS